MNQPVVLCGKGYDAEDGNNTTDSWTVTGPGGYQTTATGDHVEAAARGDSFSANLSLTTRGGRQTVSIQPQGTNITSVSLALNRR